MKLDIIGLTLGSHHVKRWQGQNVNGYRRSISEHHAEVFSWVFLMVQTDENLRDYLDSQGLSGTVYEHAMTHDISEVITGDIPYPAKKEFPSLKRALKEVESMIEEKLSLPNLDSMEFNFWQNQVVKLVVKVADMLVVANEFKEYEDEEGASVMSIMEENVFSSFAPDTLLKDYELDKDDDFEAYEKIYKDVIDGFYYKFVPHL